MSVTVTTDVFCDGVEPSGMLCQQWISGEVVGPRSDATGARKTAKRAGWVRSTANGRDYCPTCHKRMTGKT